MNNEIFNRVPSNLGLLPSIAGIANSVNGDMYTVGNESFVVLDARIVNNSSSVMNGFGYMLLNGFTPSPVSGHFSRLERAVSNLIIETVLPCHETLLFDKTVPLSLLDKAAEKGKTVKTDEWIPSMVVEIVRASLLGIPNSVKKDKPAAREARVLGKFRSVRKLPEVVDGDIYTIGVNDYLVLNADIYSTENTLVDGLDFLEIKGMTVDSTIAEFTALERAVSYLAVRHLKPIRNALRNSTAAVIEVMADINSSACGSSSTATIASAAHVVKMSLEALEIKLNKNKVKEEPVEKMTPFQLAVLEKLDAIFDALPKKKPDLFAMTDSLTKQLDK